MKRIARPAPSLTWSAALLALATLVVVPPMAWGANSAPKTQESQNSVVKVTVTKHGKLESGEEQDYKEVGTGFLWKDNSHVVTALHVVAGANRSAGPGGVAPIFVTSEATGDDRSATIEGISKRGDLALLKLSAPYTSLRRLETRPLDPTNAQEFEEPYMIWGYPDASPAIVDLAVRFIRGIKPRNTLLDVFRSVGDCEKQVGKQGFPNCTDTRILRVGEVIRHGDSGAPIFDSQGRVVAIADGGLYEGISRVNWAIPAAEYLKDAEFTNADIATLRADKSGAAFGAILPSDAGQEIAMPAQSKGKGDGGTAAAKTQVVFHLSTRVRLSEILDNLSDEEAEDIDPLAKHIHGDPLVDIYEDWDNGATIAVPHGGMQLEFDEKLHLLISQTKDESVGMLVQVFTGENHDAAVEERKGFVDALRDLGPWERLQGHQDPEVEGNAHSSYWQSEVMRVHHASGSDEDKGDQILNANLIVDDDRFLGTAIIANEKLGHTEAQDYWLLRVCARLADFASN